VIALQIFMAALLVWLGVICGLALDDTHFDVDHREDR
jgi:hypothetical protein